MAIASLDDVVGSSKTVLPFMLGSLAGATAGVPMALWRATGGYPVQGAIPGAAAVPGASAYGFPFAAPQAPAVTCLHSLSVTATVPGLLVLFDRLSHMGGLNGTLATLQAVNTAAIARGDTTGVGVEAFLEWYTATGATPVTATVSYTNDAGTAGQSAAVSLAATRPAGCVLQVPRVGTSRGVRSVQSVTLSATTGTAGNFGVTLRRRLAAVAISTANIPVVVDWATLGAPLIASDACLEFLFWPSTTSTGAISGHMTLMQG